MGEYTHLIICLIIFLLTIASFVWRKFTMATTAMLCLVLLVLTGCLDASTALSGFSNSNTIIMATMFVISQGFGKTQMVNKISGLIGRVSKGSFTVMLAGYILIIALLTQFVSSSMACFSVVFPLLLATCEEMGVSRSKVMFPLGIVSITSVTILPIGSNAVGYLAYNGYLESYGYTDYAFTFWDPVICRIPALILIILYAIYIAPKFCPEQPLFELTQDEGKKSGSSVKEVLSPFQETLGYLIFFGIVVALLTQTYHGVPVWVFTLLGAALMVASGILKPREAYQAIGLGGMVLVYAGMLGLGNALTATGAGAVVGDFIAGLVGGTHNGYIIGLVFFLAPFILTQVMLNSAVSMIFIPIVILACQSLGCNPVGPLLLAITASTTAYMTPMATPTVSMFMGLGGYDQKTVFKMSIIPCIILCVVNVVWMMTIFPAFP